MSLRGKILTLSIDKVLDGYKCSHCSVRTKDTNSPRICPRCISPMVPVYKNVPQQVAV